MSDMIDLDAPASQSGFARLVGVSQQAISKQVKSGVLTSGETNGEWLRAYCHHLRTEAAGRVADNDKTLTDQRLKESEQKTLQLAISNSKELGYLVPVVEVGNAVNQVFTDVSTEMTNAAIRIQERLESELSVTVNDELIFGPISDAAANIAATARKLGEDIATGVGEADSDVATVYG